MSNRHDPSRKIRAPRGAELSAKTQADSDTRIWVRRPAG